ncbi:DNA topoisomerase (ATP-hydrolyzing) [Clostridium sp. DL1XJH146]
MAKKIKEIPIDKNIVRVPLSEAMPDNYLPYAVEVAKERALPDVRDGLKPVHRRILYGAYKLKALPDKPYYKSARIVGDILGKYHPHGDTSVYDAMVILAQKFATRNPLIDGHGNWGSIDGDNAAAMRYTEARLTKLSMEMIGDIEKDVVDMQYNYSDSELEPKVLPARFPNLLVNGCFGIAVGLATNIPPHNLSEVIEGTIAYIEDNNISTEELMKYIKGPDFPTGGTLIGEKSILSAYKKGEGKVTLRAKTDIVKLEDGKPAVVITEFPYRKNKARLLQTISDMTADKRYSKYLEPISDIRDESDRNGIRAVIEFKKNTNTDTVEKVRKYLFKKTDLQCNISFNMVAIADNKPRTLNLKEIITYYVEHQKDVITRRTINELKLAESRFHIVEGFIIAIDIMDEIIATIRASKSKVDSERNLCAEYEFSKEQAKAIVELMLYKLSSLEVKSFQKEHKELLRRINQLKKILDDKRELLKVIKQELISIKKEYGDERRTLIFENDEEANINFEEIILEEEIYVTCSKEGFIKRISEKSYKRSNVDVNEIEYREGDENKYLFKTNTKNLILVFTNNGYMYKIRGIDLPEKKWKDKGIRLDEMINQLDLSKDKIIGLYSIDSFKDNKYIRFLTDKAVFKITNLIEFKSNYSKLMAVRLKDNEKLISIDILDNDFQSLTLSITTKSGLYFIKQIGNVEASAKNLSGIKLYEISNEDIVTNVEFDVEYNYKRFDIIFHNNDISFKNRWKKDYIKVLTDTESTLLFFTNKGNAYSLDANIISESQKDCIQIKSLFSNFDEKNEKIVNIYSISSFEEDSSLYFVSKKGLIKRTILSEFKCENSSMVAYKFKYSYDEIIKVEKVNNSSSNTNLFITKKAMGIKFALDSINYMGRVASGVTGISLKEDDEVIFSTLVDESDEFMEMGRGKTITIYTEAGSVKELELNTIKNQNRAGRGKKLIILSLEDSVIKIL